MILRKIETRSGKVFRLQENDYLLIEGLFLDPNFMERFHIDFTSFLPLHQCFGPSESLEIYKSNKETKQQTLLEVIIYRYYNINYIYICR